jgi:hypothetical protein
MMTADDVNKEVSRILGRQTRCYPSGEELCIDPDGDTTLTFGQLNELSRLFETEKIDLEYSEESGPYSDVTPGDSSSFYIRIYNSPLREAFR